MDERFEQTRNIWEGLYSGGHQLSYPNDVFVRITHRLLSGAGHPKGLDYGCGSGENLVHLAGRGFRMTGADVSSSALQTTSGRLAQAGLSAELSLLEAADLPFADASFDFVVAWQVLTYNDWQSLAVALSELERVLRPGGVFIATLSAPGDFMEEDGAPLGDGLFRLRSRGQEGALIMIVPEDRIAGLFPGKRLKTGWFGHEFDGTPSRHWVVSFEK